MEFQEKAKLLTTYVYVLTSSLSMAAVVIRPCSVFYMCSILTSVLTAFVFSMRLGFKGTRLAQAV